jgi:SAM-dependent methyltransferase
MEELFDSYAAHYDEALEKGISVSGENKFYFAQGRGEWLKRRLRQIDVRPKTILDFGCGTGTAVPYLLETGANLIGVDTSPESIRIAGEANSPDCARFFLLDQYQPSADIDLAFCTGVFHHIPLGLRTSAAEYVFNSLKPGGLFALWENNPWNPGARLVMSRIPFDRDAIMLSPWRAKKLLRRVGFEIVGIDFLFIFPRVLRLFRAVEPFVSKIPLGAQYQILCRKP